MSKSHKEIFVTIGITCFNAEKTIEKAIEGALNQEWVNKEIIIIDDGSTDNSRTLIEKKISNGKILFFCKVCLLRLYQWKVFVLNSLANNFEF